MEQRSISNWERIRKNRNVRNFNAKIYCYKLLFLVSKEWRQIADEA